MVSKNPPHLRTWIEIDTKAIAKNYRALRKHVPRPVRFMAVVKSNAYGHNIHEYALEMERVGADWLGVDSIIEALAARKSGVKIPILVLGFTLPERMTDALSSGISVTISSLDQLRMLQERTPKGKPLRVHIKVDTGMHRQGFQLGEHEELFALLSRRKKEGIVIEGLFTHFAEAKDPRSGDSTRKQIAEFEKWITLFRENGYTPICHAAATGGALLYPSAHFDMVRFGIGCYGLWPSAEAEHFLGNAITLVPTLSWRSIVSEVKSVKSGERVGYDFTELLTRDSRLAVIPVGYWHGIPRLLSGKGRTLIRGKSARIVGRVSMDMIVVDVTDIPDVRMGDEVTLIGRQGGEEIKAGEIAQFAATTHYEIVTRLNPLIQRFFRP